MLTQEERGGKGGEEKGRKEEEEKGKRFFSSARPFLRLLLLFPLLFSSQSHPFLDFSSLIV